MEWNEEAVARLRELWAQGLSTAEIGRHLNVTKNAVVGKAHRLRLEGRPSPIRRASVKKETTASTVKAESKILSVEKEKPVKEPKPKIEKLVNTEKVAKEKPVTSIDTVRKEANIQELDIMNSTIEKIAKPRKTKIDFTVTSELPKRRSLSDCCWPIGDPGTKDFHFCGAKAVPGKPYCLEHVQIAYVKLRDRKSNVA